MLPYVLKRLAWAVVVFIAVTLSTYIIFYVIPANRPQATRGNEVTKSTEQLTGLHGSIYRQYEQFLQHIVTGGSMGQSWGGSYGGGRAGGFSGGLSWTWAHTLGNLVGETAASGPVANTTEAYPEYKDPAWNNPYGSLATDVRHRVRLFGTYTLPFVPAKVGSLSVSAVQSLDTGVPYGAVGLVASGRYVANAPDYATPPSSVNYYFTARDAFRTETIYRTDLALNFSTRIAGAVEIFVQPQVLNVLNRQGLVGVSTSVRTAVNSGAYQRFNPFTTAPVQGVNWDLAPTFGTARNNLDYQLPRTFTVAAGIRF